MTFNQRILFAGRSVFHFPYYESICEALISSGAYISFIFDAESSKGQSDTALRLFLARHPDSCELHFVKRSAGATASLLRVTRELRAYCHYLRRSSGSIFYLQRQSRYLPASIRWFARVRLFRFIFVSRLLSKLLEIVEQSTESDCRVKLEIQRQNPTAIFASPINMRFSREVDFVKAGNQLGIPTFGLVQTWDNLTTKGIFHVRPNHLYCWNEQHRAEATEIHGFSHDSVSVVGAPFYDKWFVSGITPEDRTATLKRLGLDDNEHYVLYLGSSANIAKDESWIVDRLLEAIADSVNPELRLVIRPHPVNGKWTARLQSNKKIVIDSSSSLPEDVASTQELAGVIKNAEFAFGVNTSAMIDAVVLGKVCVALISSRYSKTQSEALHFEMLRKTGALRECSLDNSDDLAGLLLDRSLTTQKAPGLKILTLVRSQASQDLAGHLIAKHLIDSLSTKQ